MVPNAHAKLGFCALRTKNPAPMPNDNDYEAGKNWGVLIYRLRRLNIMLVSMTLRDWREQIGRHIIHLDFEPHGDEPFQAEIDPVFGSDGVRVTHGATSAGTTFRDESLIGLGTPARDLLIARKPLVVCQGGREFQLRAGDATFMRNWLPARSGSTSSSAYTVIVVPIAENAELESRDLGGDGVIRRGNPALQLLRSHIRVLENKSHRRLSAALQSVARRGLVDLASLLLQSERETVEHTIWNARLAAAIRFIEANYLDHSLSSAHVAAALGISVRYVNRLFEMSGQSLSERLLELRLAAAYSLIRSDGADRRISDIAQRCGFSDISAFNCHFLARFGASPKTFRPQS